MPRTGDPDRSRAHFTRRHRVFAGPEQLQSITVCQEEAASSMGVYPGVSVAMTESDDVDNMTEGKYVYWMDQDSDVPRGHLGEVVEVLEEDGKRRVQFPQGRWKLKADGLNVSDLQKGTFVHSTSDDYDFDVIGEILDLDDGKLIVEIKGEKVKQKPKKLVKCDFQPGMYVFWTRSDDDIPAGHIGTVLGDLNDEGRVKVKFPNGCWRFRPREMVRCHIQHNSYVQWKNHDDDIAKGEIGQVVGSLNDEGKVKVQFAKGCWRFAPETLFAHEMQLGSFVTWSSHDDDVPKGDVGRVIGIKPDEGRLRVQFPKGTWTFKANKLKLHHVQPGMFVHWTHSDDDIPRGSIGEVVRMRDKKNRVGVQWPQGQWGIKPKELKVLPFQKSDRVQWTTSDDDIPEGDLGIVMGISYEEDGTATRLSVKWTKGRWAMKVGQLKASNLDADSINQLKSTFKRFDKNGDGKLTVEELASVLGRLGEGGLSEDECQQLFDSLDKDSDGKLTANEFIDYIFGGEATGSQRKLLGEGFGLEDLVGTGDQSEEEEDDDNPNDSNNGGGGNVIVDPPPAVISNDPAVMEGIGPDTSVSRAEWASAMLAVGVCRQAALDSFDSCQAAMGQEGDLTVQSLAAELNGLGGAPGVEELRDAIGKVKCGSVNAVDLDAPAEESDFERELAMKTGM
ncbi:CML22 [Symbiodinium natans]|uniref:CML22 protein n=1 Tax=Symbiodinium natans TaxID=878477 RepID=A0A812RTG1_9DINO|nr:CML22 [Symbiodinium natans]